MSIKQQLTTPFERNPDTPGAFLFDSIYIFKNAGEPGSKPATIPDLLGNHDITMTYGNSGAITANGDLMLADNGAGQTNTSGLVQGINSTWAASKDGNSCIYLIDTIIPEKSHSSNNYSYCMYIGWFRLSVSNSTGDVYVRMKSATGHGYSFPPIPGLSIGDRLTVVAQVDQTNDNFKVIINGQTITGATKSGDPFGGASNDRPNHNGVYFGMLQPSWPNYYGWNAAINIAAHGHSIESGQELTEQELIDLCNDPFSILETDQDELNKYGCKWNADNQAIDIPLNEQITEITYHVAEDIALNSYKYLMLAADYSIGYGTNTNVQGAPLLTNISGIKLNGQTVSNFHQLKAGDRLTFISSTTGPTDTLNINSTHVRTQAQTGLLLKQIDIKTTVGFHVFSLDKTTGDTIESETSSKVATRINMTNANWQQILEKHTYNLKSDGSLDYDTTDGFFHTIRSLHAGQHVEAIIHDRIPGATSYLTTGWKPARLTLKKPDSAQYTRGANQPGFDAQIYGYGLSVNSDGLYFKDIRFSGAQHHRRSHIANVATHIAADPKHVGDIVYQDCILKGSNTHTRPEDGSIFILNSIVFDRFINGNSSTGVILNAVDSIFLATDAFLGEDVASYKTAGSRNRFDNCIFNENVDLAALDYQGTGNQVNQDVTGYFDSDYNLTAAGRTAIGTGTGYQGNTIINWAEAPVDSGTNTVITGVIAQQLEQAVTGADIANHLSIVATIGEQREQAVPVNIKASFILAATTGQQLEQAVPVSLTNGLTITAIPGQQLEQAVPVSISTNVLFQATPGQQHEHALPVSISQQAIITTLPGEQREQSAPGSVVQHHALQASQGQQLEQAVPVVLSDGIKITATPGQQLEQGVPASIRMSLAFSATPGQQIEQAETSQVAVKFAIEGVIAQQLEHAPEHVINIHAAIEGVIAQQLEHAVVVTVKDPDKVYFAFDESQVRLIRTSAKYQPITLTPGYRVVKTAP